MHKKSNPILSLFSLTLLSLSIGFITSIYILQHDTTIKEIIHSTIVEMFEKSTGCRMHAELSRINFFEPTVEFSHVHVVSKNDEPWDWKCKKFILSFSWFNLMWDGIIAVQVKLEDLFATSTMKDGQPAIIDHVKKIIAGIPDDIPVSLKSIFFRRAHLIVSDTNNDTLTLSWSGESKIIGSSFKSHLHIADGSLYQSDRTIFNTLSGTIESYIPTTQKEKEDVVVRLNCALGLPYLNSPNKNCFLTGYFVKDHGLFSLQSSDGSLICGPIKITESAGNFIAELHAQVPVSYISNLITNIPDESLFTGECIVHAKSHLNTTPYRLFGTASFNNVKYNNILISPFSKFSFNKQQNIWKTIVYVQCESEGSLDGTIIYDQQENKGNVTLSNRTKIKHKQAESWIIEPHNISCSINLTSPYKIDATYNLKCTNEKCHSVTNLSGDSSFNNHSCKIQGTFNENKYDIQFLTQPLQLDHITYKNNEDITLAQIHAQKDNKTQMVGDISFPFIRHLIKEKTDLDVQGQGDLKIWCTYKNNRIHLKTHLANGTIRLPHTYNFITNFDALSTIDLTTRKIKVNHADCKLHKGTITSKGAILQLTSNGSCEFTQIPLSCNSCLIHNKDDIFAVISGNLVYTMGRRKIPQLEGSILLDRTQLKENLFSHFLNHDNLSFNPSLWNLYKDGINCNLSISTKSPIRIHTPFLETAARVNVLVKNDIKNPDLSGSVELLSGTINFPYKPLFITKAQCKFLPCQPQDPILEIVAKNKIKKYSITMYVNGSLHNHTINLESTPPLSEEQIVGLLLAGSEEESLSVVAPALIMQNIKTLIFSTSSSFPELDSYMKKVFNPFKRIHLMPSFIDQSGRGGLRAAIEIDISERWRAFIQKNFSLSEDTRLEVDYFLSDDICFKAIRNEHRDVSGEVEMRWKF